MKVFDRYIQNYHMSQGAIFAEAKPLTLIRSLAFRSEVIGVLGFGETKWYITATCERLERARVDKEALGLYGRLKGMECQMELTGLLRKKVAFKPPESLEKSRQQIPTLQISDRLRRALENDEKVTSLIKSVNPAELSIRVQSAPELDLPPSELASSVDLFEQIAIRYSNDPLSITWGVTLSTILYEGPGVQRKATSIIRLFNQIFRIINRETGVS